MKTRNAGVALTLGEVVATLAASDYRDEREMPDYKIPSEEEVLGYFQTLSNWGRWGDDDEMGTLNFITPEKRLQAASLVTEGYPVSCATTVEFQPSPDSAVTPMHYMIESGEGWADGNKVSNRRSAMAMDVISMAIHGSASTHLDTPSHFFWDGKMYNGRPAHLISTSLGATAESIELVKDGITTRGVLVDAPMIRGVDWLERGEGVMPEDILSAEELCGFAIQEGDVLLVRTGQLHRRNVEGPVNIQQVGGTACQAACLPLFYERGISVIGSDSTNDVTPSGYESLTNPIHQVGLVAMGLWILDRANLEELAQACKERNRWEFMINICPLRLKNTTGSPVNPIAIF